jgi:thymidine kinase
MYFYYGAMGSSKTANALMTRFNMQEHGKRVILLKPGIDNRDGITTVKSRIGLSAEAMVVKASEKILDVVGDESNYDILIVDEAQFLSKSQVDELRYIVDKGVIVYCYGLKTDFMCNLFEGSKRLLEVADAIREIKSMCRCGRKAIVNARHNEGKIVYDGDQIVLGGDDKYQAMCYQCWVEGKI